MFVFYRRIIAHRLARVMLFSSFSFLLAFSLISCSTIAPQALQTLADDMLPSVRLTDIKLSSITTSTITLKAKAHITNKAPITINAKHITLRAYYKDKELAHTTLVQSPLGSTLATRDFAQDSSTHITIKPNATSTIPATITLSFRELFLLIADYPQASTIPLALELGVHCSAPNQPEFIQKILDREFKQRFDFSLPALKPNLTLDSNALQSGSLRFVLTLGEHIKTPFSLQHIRYHFTLDNATIQGTARTKMLHTNGTQAVELAIPARDLARHAIQVFSLLQTRNGTKAYTLKLQSQLVLDRVKIPLTLQLP